MKVLLCCIVKMENHYIEEWVKHYKKLGVDKIVIFDNNDNEGPHKESVEDVKYVKGLIDANFIDVIKIPGQTCAQIKSYNECYQKYKNDYDWFMFFDLDEFLILEYHKHIHKFLEQPIFNYHEIIHINWKIFDDNGLINVNDNDYSLVKRFKRPCKNHAANKEIKSIIRGKRNYTFTTSPHTITNKVCTCCNAIGISENSKLPYTKNISFKGAWLNHYICKTIEEYCNIKFIRKGGITPHDDRIRYTSEFFFRYNDITPEKIKYMKNYAALSGRKILDDVDSIYNKLSENNQHKTINLKSSRYINKSF